MDEQLLFNAPIWLWLVIAAGLGAAIMWVYHYCVVRENRATAAGALAERDEELGRIEAEYDANPLGRAPAGSVDAPISAAIAAGSVASGGDATSGADGAEIETLRFRVWALETRLHGVRDMLRGGEAVEAANLVQGLGELNGDAAPPREVSALKFAAWRASLGGADADAPPQPLEPKGQPAEPGAAAALAARAERAGRRFERAVAAAKAGRLDELTLIEREARADTQAEPIAARFGAAFDPAGDGAPSALRFRNWLLSSTLTRVLEQTRAGWRVDPDAVISELEAASRGAAAVKLSEDVVETAEASSDSAPETSRAELEETAEALAELNSGLRYRVWMLRRGLDPVSGEPLQAHEAGDASANETLIAALTAEKERLAEEQSALVDLADQEASGLRERIRVLEEETVALVGARDAMGDAHAAQVWALDARVAELEVEAQRLVAERSALRDAKITAERRASAERDAAKALRGRSSQAEAGLRDARWAAVEAGAAATRATADIDALRIESARASSIASASGAKLWLAERRRDGAKRALGAAQAEALKQRASVERRLHQARSDLTAAHSQLWVANWRRDQSRQALDAALAVQRSLAAEAAHPEQNPRVKAELDRLRARVAELEGDEAVSERRRREAEALRAKLALTESETERLRGALSEREAGRSARNATLGAALAAARAEVAAKPDPFAARMRRAPARNSASEPERAAPAARPDAARLRLRDLLEPARKTPLWGVESAALELVNAGVGAAGSLTAPKCLLSRPVHGAPDDLTLVSDVTPEMAAAMRGFGLYYFDQFEECAPSDLAWIDDRLELSGALIRDRWTPQARELAELKRNGRLRLGEAGYWTATEASFDVADDSDRRGAGQASSRRVSAPAWGEPVAPVAASSANVEQTMAEEAALLHAEESYVVVDAPMSGAEYAMLDMIGDPRFDSRDAAKPDELQSPEAGPSDDLTRIRSIDRKLAAALAAQNVTTYRRLAEITPQAGAWLDLKLGLGGRIPRERWQPQARVWEVRRATGWFSGDAAAAVAAPAPATVSAARLQAPTTAAPIETPAPVSVQAASSLPASSAPISARAAAEAREAEATRLLDDSAVNPEDPAPQGLLSASPAGGADDLKLIQTIGPKLEARLNDLGVYSFDQLGGFGPYELAWIDVSLGLGGRALREGWARQSVELSDRKAAGDMSIGGEGSWTLQNRGGALEEALIAARSSPYLSVEVEAMRMISGDVDSSDAARPSGLLEAPSGASPDDLKLISGVGPKLERTLNALGVYYFAQIAEFSASDLAWIDARINFKGRSIRDRWAPQAIALLNERKRGGA